MHHRIYFSVCGEGYGHSSRAMAVAGMLSDSGADVLMGGYGYVLSRLKNDFNSVEVEREFEMVGNEGAFDLKATILKSKNTALFFSRIISDEKMIIEDFNATCVVADGRNAAVICALKLGIPCVLISNQTSIEPFFRDSNFVLKLIGKPVDMTLKTLTALTENVLIPDFPAPDTVCINTLSRNRNIMKKQIFVGPVVSEKFRAQGNNVEIDMPFVLALLGGHSYRLPIFEGILKIADRFPDMKFLIFTKFKSENIPKNVILSEFAEDISAYMNAAELIVTQAGHSTAMEIMTLGKPSLLIPDKGQIEQESNAARMRELGVCETLDYDSLSPESLFEKIHILLKNGNYRERAGQYSEMAKRMNGTKRAADIILELSERVQCYDVKNDT
ncbi:UDP-N-acetylglucosamine--N-acetylmuramyl-(pentapeptide) pyrophosphoryl-undecaprenol N-acetylglucosamine transferase [uncultured archaeon]|nr:UDP-N-acetylglucosamine--N-acetylmuramyl-(pentapeptide) pyrophosphoryl-undecaprenol N-acetylglucosamine transferase [uncultured archaeon]